MAEFKKITLQDMQIDARDAKLMKHDAEISAIDYTTDAGFFLTEAFAKSHEVKDNENFTSVEASRSFLKIGASAPRIQRGQHILITATCIGLDSAVLAYLGLACDDIDFFGKSELVGKNIDQNKMTVSFELVIGIEGEYKFFVYDKRDVLFRSSTIPIVVGTPTPLKMIKGAIIDSDPFVFSAWCIGADSDIFQKVIWNKKGEVNTTIFKTGNTYGLYTTLKTPRDIAVYNDTILSVTREGKTQGIVFVMDGFGADGTE